MYNCISTSTCNTSNTCSCTLVVDEHHHEENALRQWLGRTMVRVKWYSQCIFSNNIHFKYKISFLPFTICHFTFHICYLLFAICHLLSEIHYSFSSFIHSFIYSPNEFLSLLILLVLTSLYLIISCSVILNTTTSFLWSKNRFTDLTHLSQVLMIHKIPFHTTS